MTAHKSSWLLLASLCTPVLAAQTTIGKAFEIPASQFWEGKDGPWSTFRIEVGTPRQQVRVLPSNDQSSSLFIMPEACGTGSSANCDDSRGELYKMDDSTTWIKEGDFELNTYLTKFLGLDGGGRYGYDGIGLGWSGDNLPSLDNQSIAGIITKDFWLGCLALNPRPINFTDYNNPKPALLTNLRNATKDPIPSLSWSYTAGAHNKAPKVPGKLVLGGYDASRFEPNSLTFPFGADISLDFQVAIQSISTDKPDTRLLTTPIVSYISTMVADIWLPTSVCEKFEEAFGLTWNDTSKLYLLDETTHEKLLDSNPTVSFRVGPESTGASTVIKMEYWNFYLTATADLLGANSSSSLYFPLKRAANDTQYVLGRAFLQSAYLSVDYERSQFNLSQALWPGTSIKSDIVAVLPPLSETTPGGGSGGGGSGGGDGNGNGSGDSGGGGLATGAIAGIAVGVAILFAIAGAIVFVLWRRKRKSPAKKSAELEDTDVQNTVHHEISGDGIKHEMSDGDGLKHEMQGDYDPKAELYAGGDHQKPVEADGSNNIVYEMPGEQLKRSELDSQTDVSKPLLPGEDHIYQQQQYQHQQQPYQHQSEFAHGPVDTFLYSHQDEKGGRTPSPPGKR